MALKVRSKRSKSTSDILDEIKSEDAPKNSFHVDNQCRTYTSEDLKREECFGKESIFVGKKHSIQKSQNFVKKLIASLEKRNEACKADDEFFTKLYKKNDTEIGRSTLPSDKTDPNSTIGKIPMLSNIDRNEHFAIKNDNLKKSKFGDSREKENSYLVDEQNKKYVDLQRNANANGNKVKTNFFDSNRSQIELETQTDLDNSYFLKKNDKHKKKFVNSKSEEKSKKFNSTCKKKLNRNKSFKDLFGSVIKWRKSERKDASRYFMSCDHLHEELESKDKKLTRTSSFPTVVFRDFEEEYLKESNDRKATIRPIYGGKRNEQHLQTFVKKEENPKFFDMEESVEGLAKPSDIKNIAKHLSVSKEIRKW